MGNRMNEQAVRSNISYYPIRQEVEDPKPSWILRAANWIGVTMAQPEHPRGWSFNPATVTLMLVILGMVAGGAYYMGQRDNESQNLLKRLEAAEKKAESADTKATYAVSGKDKEDGHGPNTNQNKK